MKGPDLLPWLKVRLGSRIEDHGDEQAVPCPTCDDASRKSDFRLWFNVKKNVGTCYKCSRGFDAVGLVRAIEGVSLLEAIQLVKEHTVSGVLNLHKLKAHVETAFAETQEEQEVELPEVPLPEGTRLCSEEPVKSWPPYILQRLGSRKEARAYDVGWCTRGYYSQRMLIPLVVHGKLVSFVARDMTGKADRKVLYPKGAKTSRILFNFDVARRFEQVVLVEGVLDAIRVGPKAMAVLGTHLSDSQVGLLAQTKAREVVLLLDGDAAGREGARKMTKRLGGRFQLRVVGLPSGCDPDDLPREALWERIGASRGGFAERVRRGVNNL